MEILNHASSHIQDFYFRGLARNSRASVFGYVNGWQLCLHGTYMYVNHTGLKIARLFGFSVMGGELVVVFHAQTFLHDCVHACFFYLRTALQLYQSTPVYNQKKTKLFSVPEFWERYTWNPSIAATLGEHFGRGCTQTVPGCLSQLAFIQGWPLRGVPLYTVRVENFVQFKNLSYSIPPSTCIIFVSSATHEKRGIPRNFLPVWYIHEDVYQTPSNN